MERRAFLSSMAALPAVASLDLAQAAAPPAGRRGLKLGIVTYNIGKDWDVPTIIKNLTEVGFDGVELRTTHKHGVEIALPAAARADVKKQFEASTIKMGGFGTTCDFHSPAPASSGRTSTRRRSGSSWRR